MALNSIEFLAFFTIVFVIYQITNLYITDENIKNKCSQVVLLLASLSFCGYVNIWFVPIIIYISAVTFLAGIILSDSKSKYCLIILILMDIIPLLTFKYFNFISHIFNGPAIQLILPLGISFYTLQSITYIVDIWKGRITVESNPIVIALFVSFFPVLSSGPIQRAKNLIPQLKKNYLFNYDDASNGMKWIAIGIIKKMVIADSIGIYVDQVYRSLERVSGTAMLVAVILYSFQIYCDFSGYTNMSFGCAKMFGIDVGKNFNHPYLASGVGDFWHRWHISLSTWLRDYVYIPLGGNKIGVFRTYVNIMITFCVSGIWHGAAWHFIIWGMIHGAYVCIERFIKGWGRTGFLSQKNKIIVQVIMFSHVVMTFVLVTVAWIFFRVSQTKDVLIILRKIMRVPQELFSSVSMQELLFSQVNQIGKNDLIYLVGYLVIFFIISIATRKKSVIYYLNQFPMTFRWIIYTLVLFAIFFLSNKTASAVFIYNQF